ncbi:MAG: hypothetical protein M3Q69_09290 [Acidobacteriota bacterium]|nr:hypothetical protein [Acidobacteriota bacterium]
MKRNLVVIFTAFACASAVFAQSPAAQVAADAAVVDRVAEMSKRDLPRDLLRRLVDEDLELLRGRRTDGSYEYATYERFESGRVTSSFSVQPRKEKMETFEVKGANVYRVIVDAPSRRLLVRKNRPVWVERVDVEFVGEGASQVQQRSFEVKSWMQPGTTRPIDLPVIARQVTARVIATAEEKGGYGNIDVALVQARIVDLPSSPFADAVGSAKALQRALDNGDLPSIRATAQRMRDALSGSATTTTQAIAATNPPAIDVRPSSSQMTVTAPADSATRVELQTELQMIEDLLTGSESERRQGLDRLHQMIRRMRP